MQTIASEQPRASARPQPAGKNFNLRAFFAGGTATVALVAAGVIVFGSLAAYVAFNGLPVDGGDDGSGSVAVESSAANASAPANAGLGAAPGAVAATPAAATAIAPPPGTAPDGTAANGAAPGTAPGATGATTPTETAPAGTTPAGSAPGTTATGADTSTSSGPVGSAVHGAENVASGVGVDPPLSETTQGITGPVDQGVQDTLDGVGSVVGNPDLGQPVDNVTDGLLGN